MSMTRITFAYAGILFVLGTSAYLLTMTSKTALIPAFVSIPFFILAGVSLINERIRMHAMHVAAALALLIIVGLGVRMVSAGIVFNIAGMAQLTMIFVTVGYVVACVGSFISARRRRKKGA